MGDMGEMYRDMKDYRRKLRVAHGVPCPRCREVQPKREPTIMLPGQRCKVDGYKDPRPRLTDEQVKQATGWSTGQ